MTWKTLVAAVACSVGLALGARGQEEGAAPKKVANVNKGKLVASEFCPYGTIGAPVGISVDAHGRVFVTETNRRTQGELDIRKHWDFLPGTLASRSVEDKRAFIRENYHKGDEGDQNGDGTIDWHDLLVPSEKINLLTDSDGDGKFDRKQVFAEGFNTEITGVAGGVLAFGGSVYTTIQPDLWKLTDTNGDGRADERVSLSHGHGIHVGYGGHDMHGPTMGPDGRIYWSQGDKGYNITSREGRNFAHQYQGAVFRVEPDGSNLEVFAYGLRNPQELAFDDFGNLFSVDNDADLGDRERFVYIVQDTDNGWRGTYQYRTRKIPGVTDGGYNPWMAEELWKPRFDTQAAYLTPPLANYSDGPCGFKYNPGTALSDEYKGHFFLTQFPKKWMTTFRAEPDGAGFKMVNERIAFSGLMLTGIDFGPDGAIYSADWGENAWAPHQNGRVVRIDVPGSGPHSAMRVETQHLLAEGMKGRPIDELVGFLGYADQRVRLRAQFELVGRGAEGAAALLANAKKNENLLARVHAIWGVGQLGRKDVKAIEPIVALLKDPEVEVRAQAIKVIQDAAYAPAADAIAELLKDPSPRVRLFAGVALSKIGGPKDFDAIVAMLDANKVKETFIRHAGVVALVKACEKDATPLAGLASHPNRNVRLAAIVALRRLGSPLVERFLADKDEWVVAEAARAIHDDESIPQALPALAKVVERSGVINEPLLRRAVNANLRVGDEASARRLVAFATSGAPAVLRADALNALAWFARTPKLDRVEGCYRELGNRDPRVPQAALDPAITRLLKDPAPGVRNATVGAIQQLHFDAARDRLAQIALDGGEGTSVRAAALRAIQVLGAPQTGEAARRAMASDDARLRAAGLEVLAKIDPANEQTMGQLKKALEGPSGPEAQAALAALGGMKSKPAVAVLGEWVDRLAAGKVPAALQLDVVEAGTASKDRAILSKLRRYEAAKGKGAMAKYAECLEGGDGAEGEAIFRSGQCTQCHLLGGVGGNVGPDLSHVASRLPRRDLLESIVSPNAKIAEGFGTISVTTKDGDSVTGTLQKETAEGLVLKSDDGEVVMIKAADVDSRTKPSSAMPPMAEVLRAGEIRDVVEFLSGLK